jgi:hypothetical protein
VTDPGPPEEERRADEHDVELDAPRPVDDGEMPVAGRRRAEAGMRALTGTSQS